MFCSVDFWCWDSELQFCYKKKRRRIRTGALQKLITMLLIVYTGHLVKKDLIANDAFLRYFINEFSLVILTKSYLNFMVRQHQRFSPVGSSKIYMYNYIHQVMDIKVNWWNENLVLMPFADAGSFRVNDFNGAGV